MISVQHLTYTYPGSRHAVLRDISFGVSAGEIFGFLGPSGAGKSTTQKVLNGILKNYQGSVVVNGQQLSQIHSRFYECIGVAFEFPNLYGKLTALENLRMVASFYRSATLDPEELLGMVGLWEDRHLRVEAFSKGMKMRLNFVRALINDPLILFLDEPTSGLDPANARIMKDIILGLRQQGKTIFLTTHNMSDADELCDRLAFMVEGQIPVIDTPHHLKLLHGQKVVRVGYSDNGTTHSQEFAMEGIGANPVFQQLLHHPALETIHTQEATLESIFIKVTGQKLKA